MLLNLLLNTLLLPDYSSTRRNLIHCARRSFLNPRTAPETRCETEQNGQTKRVPCELGAFSTLTAHPGLQNRCKTCVGAALNLAPALTGLAGGVLRAAFRGRAARRPVDRDFLLRDALICILSTSLLYFAKCNRPFRACAAAQSACRNGDCGASWLPASGIPRAFADGCP
jgi:hypothetical protein